MKGEWRCSTDPKGQFVALISVFFGLWLLYVGLMKWFVFGPGQFISMLEGSFAKTWVPPLLTRGLTIIILVAEPLLGLWLMSCKLRKLAWFFTSLLMFQLMLGQTILQEQTVFQNWGYCVLAVLCFALSENKGCGTTETAH